MSRQLEEWEHHVRHTREDLKGTTWCGERAVGWCFEDVDHIAVHRLNRGRLLPCPDCLRAIMEALQSQ